MCWMNNEWLVGTSLMVSFISVHLLSYVWLFVTPWTAACQASLSITKSQSLVQPMSIESVSDAIQPSHLLSSPSSPAFNLSQHQGLFQWVSSLHQVAKVLELQLQHQSLQWIFRTDPLVLTFKNSLCNAGGAPTCHRATKPVCCNYWAHVPQLENLCTAIKDPVWCNEVCLN